MIHHEDEKRMKISTIKYIVLISFGILFLISVLPSEVQATESIIVSRGENFQISATLLTNGSFGEPLAYQDIEFFDQTNDQLIGLATTDAMGIAVLEHTFPISYPKGSILLNATFRGNQSLALAPSCQWIPIILVSATTMEIQSTKSHYAPDDIMELSIRLIDDADAPISNATLEIYCDHSIIAANVTDSDGQSSITIDFLNNSIYSGSHEIEVVYQGDSVKHYRGTREYLAIEIQPISTSVIPSTQLPSIFQLNESLQIDIEVLSEEGNLENVSVHFSVDDIPQGTALTNQSGIASIIFQFDDDFAVGIHTISISFDGNVRYNCSTIEHYIFLQSEILLHAIYDDRAILNTTMTISLHFSDIYNRPFPESYINWTDISTGYSNSLNVYNSTAVQLDFAVNTPIGNRTIEIFGFSPYGNPTVHLLVNISIWTNPRVSIESSNIWGYASPDQIIYLNLNLNDQLGPLSDKSIRCHLLESNWSSTVITNQDGNCDVSIPSPSNEGQYTILFECEGNNLEFRLPVSYAYDFKVSFKIPVRIQDFVYDIDHLLKTISVNMQLQALNGTSLEGVGVNIKWLGNTLFKTSATNGILNLILTLPSTAGVFELGYEILSINGIESISDRFHIIISPIDANTSEGIGFFPLLFGVTGSFSIPIVPIIRKKSITK